jgi:hypothetical protein
MRSARRATAAAFLAQGLLFATLVTRLPSFKDRYDIGDGVITAVILGITLCAGLGSVLAAAGARRWGSGRTLAAGMAGIAIGVLGTAPDAGLGGFLLASVVYGLALGVVDAAGNMQAVAVEHGYGRSILTSFHAVWSAAGIAGAVWTWGAGEAGVPLGVALAAPAAVVLLLTPLAAPRLLPASATGRADEGVAAAPAVPRHLRRAVLGLGAAMAAVYVVDSGVSSWSAIYLHDVLGAATSTAALGYAAYQGTALLSRVAGDHLVRRRDAVTVVGTGALVVLAGCVVVVAGPGVPATVVAFGVVGLGAGVVAPLCFAAVGALAPGAADGMIASVNVFNYVGAVGGGVLVGALGTATTLRAGFVVTVLAAVVLVMTARAFVPRPGPEVIV